MSTMDIIEKCFGWQGAVICAFVICGACMSWLQWQIRFCAQVLSSSGVLGALFTQFLASRQLFMVVSFLFLLPSFFGENRDFFMNRIVIPLLCMSFLITHLLFPYTFSGQRQFMMNRGIDISEISAFLNTWLLHSLSIPALCSSSRLIRQSRKNISILFLIILPSVCSVGIIQGLSLPNESIVDIFPQKLGVWHVSFLIYIICGGLAICYINVFYCTDILANLFDIRSRTQLALLLGGITYVFVGTASEIKSSFGPAELFNIMTVIIVVIISIRSTTKIHISQDDPLLQQKNCYSLIVATFVGLLTQTGCVSMTGVPSFDAGLTAFALSAYYSRARNRRSTSLI